MTNEIIYVPTSRYVYFDNAGEITSVSNRNDLEGTYVTVELNEVLNLITGKEVISNYVVLYDTVTKQHVVRSRYVEEEIQFNINNQIYKLPTVRPERPDFTLQQDIKNKRWNLILDKSLADNLKAQTVKFTSALNFSITSKNDPHNLYQYFVVDLNNITENYSIPFVSGLELDEHQISVYTTKRLETYYHEVLQ
tara:strand:+ start:154 stop:735 length:582 start_codon:yes stop_codon:yes gene_type:complete